MLVDDCYNFVARLESCYMLADCEDGSCAVGAGNDVLFHAPWIFSFGDEDIAELDGIGGKYSRIGMLDG